MPIRPDELPRPEALEAFFLEGMCATGWSSPNPEIIPHPNLVGWKQTLYIKSLENGQVLRLIDSWGDGQGFTQITLRVRAREILLWIMHYKHGTIFSKDSLPHIMPILDTTYSRRKFHGGRGAPHHTARINYWNIYQGGFSQFSGKEELWICAKESVPPSVLAGDTTYWGGCLI